MPSMTRGTASTLLPWRIAKRPTKDHAPRSVDTLRIVVCVTLEAAYTAAKLSENR